MDELLRANVYTREDLDYLRAEHGASLEEVSRRVAEVSRNTRRLQLAIARKELPSDDDASTDRGLRDMRRHMRRLAKLTACLCALVTL